MSGRQAHGRPLLPTAGSRKKNGLRGGPGRIRKAPGHGRVDVLALAEKQIGETKSRGVRQRDLDIERDPSKRRRGNDDEDGEERDSEGDNSGRTGGASNKRRRRDEDGGGDGADDSDEEMHSDSDGNEWHLGVGSDDDDSEIDSDEAFGESDEEMFDGYAFRGSTSKNKKKKHGDLDDSDNNSDVGDDGDALGEDAIDLAQALDQVSSDEEEEPDKKQKKQKKQKRDVGSDDDDSASVISASEDSEADSDDEESQVSSDADSDEDDEDSDSDASDASDASNFETLKDIASAFAGPNKDADAMAGAASNKVSLDDLGLFEMKDPQIKKSLKLLAKEESGEGSKKLEVPLARIHQDRLDRGAAADKAHETLGRWVDTVKHNRRAEHLAFPVADQLAGSGLHTLELQPINQKSAKSELEKTIMSIMEESGLGPSERKQMDVAAAAADEKALSPEELKQLVSQRRHQREVQSREQARARRIKKIKSKAYRRVHRRERAKNEAALAELEEGEDADSDADREAQHRRRAMERMGSRHRESKWAKRAKNTGRAAWDDDFRTGLVDMARRDEELRRRIDGRGSGDEEASSSDEEEDDEAFRLRAERALAGDDADGDDEPKSALMNIAFMQKAELARKKANDKAVAELLHDLDPEAAAADSDNGDEDEDKDGAGWTTVGRRTYGAANAAKVGHATAKAVCKTAKADEPTAAAAETAEATTLAAASWGANSSFYREDTSMAAALAPGAAGAWTRSAEAAAASGGGRRKKEAAAAAVADRTLQMDHVLANVIGSIKAKADGQLAKTQKKPAAAADDDDDTSSSGSSSDDDDHTTKSKKSKKSKAVRGGMRLRDSDLLMRALGEDDAAAEFAREKARVAAEEAEAAEAETSSGRHGKAEFLPGWGSWAGEGISKKAAKRDQKWLDGKGSKKDGKGKDGKTVARRDTKLECVIISERRVAKTTKYLASQLPHEFETKNQYERSLRLPIGPEWGTKTAFQDSTKPRLLTKQGVVLPMARPLL